MVNALALRHSAFLILHSALLTTLVLLTANNVHPSWDLLQQLPSATSVRCTTVTTSNRLLSPTARGLASATCIILAFLGVLRLRASDTNALILMAIETNGQLQAVEPPPTLTNHFFLTEGSDFIMSIPGIGDVVNPEVVEKARHAKECQPAEEDPEGNWGKPTDGLQVSIRFDKASFAAGEPILATIIFRNLTNHPMTVPLFLQDYRSELVVTDENGKPLETRDSMEERRLFEEGKISDFQRKLRHILNNPKSSYLIPHCQHKCQVELDKLFDPTQPGRYRVYARDLDKSLSSEATSGTAQITITAGRQPKPQEAPKSTQP
jgi:hypothetical protein